MARNVLASKQRNGNYSTFFNIILLFHTIFDAKSELRCLPKLKVISWLKIAHRKSIDRS